MADNPQEQERLRRIYEQQKVPGTVMKSRESSGMSNFLRKKDPNLSNLKDQYFKKETTTKSSLTQSAYKEEKQKFKHWSDIERYIDRRKRETAKISLYQRFHIWFNDWFKIRIDGKSVYVWHARRL